MNIAAKKFIWVVASLWNALFNYCTQWKYYHLL